MAYKKLIIKFALAFCFLPIALSAQKDEQKTEFIAGKEIIYSENFRQDVLNEFPLKWFTNHTGPVKEIEGFSDKWFRMSHSGRYLSPLIHQPLPLDFTVSFDLILDLKYDGYVFPVFGFSLIENIKNDKNARLFLNEDPLRSEISTLDFLIAPGIDDNSDISFQYIDKGKLYFYKEGIKIKSLGSKYGKKIRVNLWVQNHRLRLWIDDEKLFDIPRALPGEISLNRLAFDISSSIQPDEELGFYISNINIAAALPDLRKKLIDEGKYSTSGILFNFNSDEIMDISIPLIEDVGRILSENPEFNFIIAGHTDDVGNELYNIQLSEKRANAIKDMLVKNFNISPGRLKTKGMGKANPIADNKTDEGRAVNRRVEFIRE